MIHFDLSPGIVEAYVYSGVWIADCSYKDCRNAQPVHPGKAWRCVNCNHLANVVWPDDAEGIERTLAMRPVPGTRNWAPAGHRQAISCGFPDGQTVDDLRAENQENL